MASTQATQHGGQPRQSLRRFDLASVSINDSLNKFKDPQLVLKTQVDLAPRVPYTGSRARKSVWRHLLLIHVRDKADELEKLDLDAFAVFSKAKTATGDYSLEWYSSENILVFRYPKDRGNKSNALTVRFLGAADLEVVYRELSALGIKIQENLPGDGISGRLAAPEQNSQPYFGPSNNAGYSQPSSHPVISPHEARHQFSQDAANRPYQVVRPPGTPAVRLTRPATTLGIPGILGEGIYRVSKLRSVPTARPRPGHLISIPGPPGRPSPLVAHPQYDSSHEESSQEGMETGSEPNNQSMRTTTPPSFLPPTNRFLRLPTASNLTPNMIRRPVSTGTVGNPGAFRFASALRGTHTRQRPMPNRPNPVRAARPPTAQGGYPFSGGASPFGQSGFTSSSRSAPTPPSSQSGFTSSNLNPAAAAPRRYATPPPSQSNRGSSMLPSSPPTLSLPIPPPPHEEQQGSPTHFNNVNSELVLLRVAEIHHRGFTEASMLWDEYMEKCQRETRSIKDMDQVHKIWLERCKEFDDQLQAITKRVAREMHEQLNGNSGGSGEVC